MCGNNVSHYLLQTVFSTPVNSVPCYSTVSFFMTKKKLVKWPSNNTVLREWREQAWSEILEVLTPAQGYLMFFNNRGLTASPLVSLSNPIHFFSINSFLLKYPSCPHPTVILRKILDCGHSYLRGFELLSGKRTERRAVWESYFMCQMNFFQEGNFKSFRSTLQCICRSIIWSH